MKARMFRYLFENIDNGIVLSGGIRDTVKEQYTNFTYICGIRSSGGAKETRINFRFERSGEVCHVFVLASFTFNAIKALLNLVSQQRVRTVVLPYIAPKHRLALLQWYASEGISESEVERFMKCPYTYLKDKGVDNVYLLYGNGEDWQGEGISPSSGHHFELIGDQELQRIREQEGCYIPVVKAGYLIESDWLFYFGLYGYESNRYAQPGGIVSSSILMFQGPLNTNNREIDSIMTGKIFAGNKGCNPYFSMREEKNCFYQCQYEEDHVDFRKHKKRKDDNGCFGTFTVGNVNLGRFLPEIRIRFDSVWRQVRAVTLPGCGSREYWNRQFLAMALGENIKYWICGLDRTTSPSVISDVAVASPLNRIVTVSEEYGCCFSGYLVPFGEESTEI